MTKEAGLASRLVDSELTLTVGAPRSHRVRVVKAGEPVARARTLWVDLTATEAQPSFQLRSDDDGWVESSWLVPGRRYALLAAAERPAYLELSEEIVDLEKCERDVGRFLAAR